ncbi:MAG: hypothetical protein UX16_C0011G0011 [Parcubacteria group bacterium GW2011_GWB1_45_7]|nr:MAG: hypothetical protein UX16_C0011G0011 [Parcubacteria group bacterium GW2011_GWB1_45_7]OGY61602.1 MAG: hypothetical protein A3I33_00830 [Candidatus Colwellbacteria bacterium RIFCSPLOWO2_02_FULL_45_11]
MREEHRNAFASVVAEVGGFTFDQDSSTARLELGATEVVASAHSDDKHEFFKVTTRTKSEIRGVTADSEDILHPDRFRRVLEERKRRALATATGGT